MPLTRSWAMPWNAVGAARSSLDTLLMQMRRAVIMSCNEPKIAEECDDDTFDLVKCQVSMVSVSRDGAHLALAVL
jgi:hypothetical protein